MRNAKKRIIRAENKAARKIKNEKQSTQHRSTSYSTSQSSRFNSNAPGNNVPVQRPGKCYECGIPRHWRVDHQLVHLVQQCKETRMTR
ncbi:Hypothetical predicted protein [Mytilus galloprovincialis]|uniref:Uncharacterized protein n=1 Tax=Mytilus galloprovincialis TaxID=29158 RepID=A0A8B6D6A5_MYTGA|nr:Hypothetical predicted protein [Mytilus galloprovincialis]